MMGCCEDCGEPLGTLQDTVSFSELNEYLVSALGQSWSGSVRRSVTEICSRNVFFNDTVTNGLVKCMTNITYHCCRCSTLTHCGRVTQICVFNTVKLCTSASSP